MKRLWATLIIFVVLTALCLWGAAVTGSVTSSVGEGLVLAQNAAQEGDLAKALLLSKRLAEDWPAQHELLCTYMPHSRLEAIDQNLAALPYLLSSPGSEAQFAAECSRCAAQLRSLREAELPALQNLL